MISNATIRLVKIQEPEGILDGILRLEQQAAERTSMSYERLKR